MGAERARIESTAAEIADAVRTAALYGDGTEPHEQMFVRVDSNALETPASAPDASQSSYCTITAEWFDRLSGSEPVDALFPVERVLDWISWFEDDEQISVSFVGDERCDVASTLRLDGAGRTVEVDCIDDPAIVSSLDVWLPARFEDGLFYDDGQPLPTRIETSTSELERIVGAADRCDLDSYPLRVADGNLSLTVEGKHASASETLDSTVDGPDFHEWYGDGFARFVRAVEGTVTLQTGPGAPLVIVRDGPGVTLRSYIAPAE